MNPLTFALALAATLGLLLLAHSRRRDERRLDRLFWALTLRPLARLAPDEAARRLRVLAGTPLAHPIDGQRLYAQAVLERRYAALAGLPVEEIAGTELRPLAVRLDRMCRGCQRVDS